MVDGIAGVDLLAALLRLEPDAPWPEVGEWRPRAAPSRAWLLADEVWRRASLPLSVMRAAPELLARPGEAIASARQQLAEVGVAVGGGIAATTRTCLNTAIGPTRRFDWTSMPLDEVRDVGEPVGPDALFQVMVPVSVRQPAQRGAAGNRVVNFLARLPLDERDPRRRLERIIEETQRLKQARGARGAEILEELSDRTFTGLLAQLLRLEASTRAYNLVVSNVPGPPVPVYLLGARMTDIYPFVPLFSGQALAIGLFSYAGQLCWGFDACWDSLPDLHELVEGVTRELALLREAAARTHAV
jgi:hypothetical protein